MAKGRINNFTCTYLRNLIFRTQSRYYHQSFKQIMSTTSAPSKVWLLGQLYNLPEDAEKMIDDIRSKIWITYRKNFALLDESYRYTTDRGFGCMIRCGQMVLANALLLKIFGRSWRWSSQGLDHNPELYLDILKLFQDKETSPYSIHSLVKVDKQDGKAVGDWFGPNTIAHALKKKSNWLMEKKQVKSDFMISIHNALDNIVVIQEVKSTFKHRRNQVSDETEPARTGGNGSYRDAASDNIDNSEVGSDDQSTWVPGILFIQLRLGLANINDLYFRALKKTFQFKNSLGIIGGRPNHALYFIGYSDDNLIYLDPHSTQTFVDFDADPVQVAESQLIPSIWTDNGDQSAVSPLDHSYHCDKPERMPLDRLDPSLALCFYFDTEDEFDDWCKMSEDLLIKSERAPMFEIAKTRSPSWMNTPEACIMEF